MLNKTIKFIKNNKMLVFKLAFMGYASLHALDPSISLASTTVDSDLPFATGVQKIYDNMTGPLAQIGCGVSVVGAGVGWMQGDSQIAKTATRVCIGSGVVLGAPTLVNALSGIGSGALF